MNQLLAELRSLVAAWVVGVLSADFYSKVTNRKAKGEQFQKVTGEVSFGWTELGPSVRELSSAELVIRNNSLWTVPEVIVLEPQWLLAHIERDILPKTERRLPVSLESLGNATDSSDAPVTLQVVDARGRTWVWTPATQEFEACPAKIPLHARMVQMIIRVGSGGLGRGFQRLPGGVQSFLWGYDPRG